MIPESVTAFYAPDCRHEYEREIAQNRQKDCDLAVKTGLFEKVSLPSVRYWNPRYTDTPPMPYDWFYTRAGEPHDLATVISPATRVPNYTTRLDDALELAIAVGMTELPITRHGEEGIKDMIKHIIETVDGR